MARPEAWAGARLADARELPENQMVAAMVVAKRVWKAEVRPRGVLACRGHCAGCWAGCCVAVAAHAGFEIGNERDALSRRRRLCHETRHTGFSARDRCKRANHSK